MLVEGAFEKAKKYIRQHSSADISKSFKPGPCITISRETGCEADKISDAVIHLLESSGKFPNRHWAVFDKNLIQLVLDDHHLPQKLEEYLSEEKTSALSSAMNEMLGIHPPLWKLVKQSAETILQLAHIGNCIIVGRGANIITAKLQNVFHVRMIAPYEVRVENIMSRFNFSNKDAIKFIKKEEASRKNYVKEYFHCDADDSAQYHLTINVHLCGIEGSANIIASAVERLRTD